jgi:hypothetical protein
MSTSEGGPGTRIHLVRAAIRLVLAAPELRDLRREYDGRDGNAKRTFPLTEC